MHAHTASDGAQAGTFMRMCSFSILGVQACLNLDTTVTEKTLLRIVFLTLCIDTVKALLNGSIC